MPEEISDRRWSEADRLAALNRYEVLDTPTEAEFDDVARLAADLCGTPIAVVNFVASARQWFKAEVGLGVRETPLETSFCRHALLEHDVLVVPDTTRDPRFACNPLVTDPPHLRFYAGALLKTEEGLPIGTVCVLDHEPRDLSPRQVDALRALARQVMSHLRLRLTLQERRASEGILRESEARFRNMADDAPVMMWVTDPSGYCTYLNRRWYEFTGQSDGEAEGFGWLEATHPDDKAEADRVFRAANAAHAPFRIEYRLRRADGTYGWAIDAAVPRFGADGVYLGYVGSVIDIDERKRIEVRRIALTELDARFRELGDTADLSFAAAEILGRVLDVSRAGYGTIDPVTETITIERDWNAPGVASLAGVLHFRDYGSYIEDLKRGETVVFADAEKDPRTNATAGALKAISARSVVNMPVQEMGGLVALLYLNHASVREWSADELAFVREVAERTRTAVERRRAEMRLRESEQQFRTFAQAMANHAWTSRADGNLDWFNDRVYQYGGAGAGELDGNGWVRMVHPDDIGTAAEAWGDSLRTGADYQTEFRLRRADGAYRWHIARALALRGARGEVTRWIGTNTDIQDVVEAREVLAKSGRELAALVEERTQERDRMWSLIPDLLMTGSLDGRLLSINPAWTQVLGHDEAALLARPFWEFIDPDFLSASGRAVEEMRQGLTARHQNRVRTSAGDYRWFDWVSTPVGDIFYAVARDITAEKAREAELEQAQEALRQSQKMEVVGQLTGGIAHDFNNLLQIVTGNLDILQRNLPEDAVRLRRSANNAMTGAQRAAALTQRLLAFSRRQPLDPKPISVNRLVTGMSDLLGRTLGETIEIETVLAGGLWQVETDPNQLENAILNLAVNARDAMPDGGKLTIETANGYLDHAYAAQNAEVQPGQYVVICVSDTGSGMDAETLAKVFEPFFTTKEVGRGTGLGLSQVYGFVKQSGGNVKLYSEPGEGTTVKIYLPRLLNEAAEEESAAEHLAPEGMRSETVLVLEDDDDVRAYSVEVLRELGYRVLEAHDGPSAIRLLERQEGRVDLLFSDVVLPGGMTGAAVAQAARELLPQLKVLFTTGYARNAIVHQGRLDPGVQLLTKPFTYADLAARVRDVLDGQV